MNKSRLYIGGGFDILHQDHKKFIERGIKIFVQKYGALEQLIIGLNPDSFLNAKGTHKPFFSYEWREEDISDFLSEKNINFKIISATEPPPDEGYDIVAIVRSDFTSHGEELMGRGITVEYADPFNSVNTSTIEKRLFDVRDMSKCNLRKVGALLVRKGQIISEGYSGSGDVSSCPKEIAYNNGVREELPKFECNSPHAEIVALSEAIKGDDLISTCSPCQSCAELMLDKGIRRVVYTQGYYDLSPVTYLRNSGVMVRMAGK